MDLLIRMVLYFASALIAGQGVAVFDADAGTLTFNLESTAVFLGGAATFVVTFIAGRWAKVRGGLT